MHSSEMFETRRVKIPRIIAKEKKDMYHQTFSSKNSKSLRLNTDARHNTIWLDENKELKTVLNSEIVAKYANPN